MADCDGILDVGCVCVVCFVSWVMCLVLVVLLLVVGCSVDRSACVGCSLFGVSYLLSIICRLILIVECGS